MLPFGVFFTPGPLLAAVTVVGLTRGRPGFVELGRRMTRWRVGSSWYALAVAVPVGVQLLIFGTNLILGAGPPTSLAQLAPLSILGAFAVRLVNPLDGPLAEEPGWRAFAQPRLQLGRSRLGATMILAGLVACWHLPLWLLPHFGATPSIIVADTLGTLAVIIWYSWLFNHSGGSALLPDRALGRRTGPPAAVLDRPGGRIPGHLGVRRRMVPHRPRAVVVDPEFWSHRSHRVEDRGSAAIPPVPAASDPAARFPA